MWFNLECSTRVSCRSREVLKRRTSWNCFQGVAAPGGAAVPGRRIGLTLFPARRKQMCFATRGTKIQAGKWFPKSGASNSTRQRVERYIIAAGHSYRKRFCAMDEGAGERGLLPVLLNSPFHLCVSLVWRHCFDFVRGVNLPLLFFVLSKAYISSSLRSYCLVEIDFSAAIISLQTATRGTNRN